MESEFCVEALEEALSVYGKPEMFNTDQGAQYTSNRFVGLLESHGIRVSMDGKGRYVDNIVNERLRRTVKYDCVYRYSFDGAAELRKVLQRYIHYYNCQRPRQTLKYETPDSVYFGNNDLLRTQKENVVTGLSSLSQT